MSRKKFIQVENKNAILELLQAGRECTRILVASNSRKDPKAAEILMLASMRQIPIEKLSRRALQRYSKRAGSLSMIALMASENQWKLDSLLESIYSRNEEPFFIIFNHVGYSRNVGAVLRTAFAAGVNGVIIPVKKSNIVNDEVLSVSMGAAERIPMVEMNLFNALKTLKDNDIPVYGLHMEGTPFFECDLRGPVALLIGAEDEGISSAIMKRVDKNISIPMMPGIESLNVSVSAAIVIYEKIRQALT